VKKREKRDVIVDSSSELSIPSSVFQNRNLSVLEAMVVYLKEDKSLKYSEIAKLLNRDDRTIWTVYNRAKKKRDDK